MRRTEKESQDLEYIRNHYCVPAKIGTHVKFQGKNGKITGASGAYLKIKMDGETRSWCYHPTWEIEYLTQSDELKPE